MKLSDALSPDMVLPNVPAGNRQAVAEALAAHVVALRPDLARAELSAAFQVGEVDLARADSWNYAVVRAPADGLSEPFALLARFPTGPDLGVGGVVPNLLGVVYGPNYMTMRLMSAFTRVLADEILRRALWQAPDAAAMFTVFMRGAAGH